MDKYIVVDDPNDKFAIVDDQHDKFAEHQQPHYKFAVTEDSERAFTEGQSPVYKYSVAEGSPEARFAEAQSPHHKFTVEDGPQAERAAQDEQPSRKAGWPLWKKLTIAAIALLVILALAVGLGVGLTQGKGESEASDASDGQGQQGGSDSGSGDNNDEGGSNGGNQAGGDGPETPNNGGGNSGNSTTPSKPSEPGSWVPKIGDSFQVVITNPLRLNKESDASPDVNIYDIDLFDNDPETISSLQDAGRHVLCYFSAGSWEEWREDKGYFEESDLGKQLADYPGERYVNISSPGIRSIMKGRISRAKKAGCNGIDPGYIDSYNSPSDNGLNLTQADAIDYVKYLSTEARSQGLAIGLKNGGDIVSAVIDWVDFSINEACLQWDECADYVPFIKAGKAVFNIEYPKGAPDKVSKAVREEICSKKGTASEEETTKFTTILKTEGLDGWVMYCDGKSYDTDVNDLGQ